MRYLLAMLIFLFCQPSLAHQLSTAYMQAELNNQGELSGSLQIRLYDLERSLAIDPDQDGVLHWSELLTQQPAINQFILSKLRLARAEKECSIFLDPQWMIDQHFNEGYVVIPLRAQCPLDGALGITYHAFFAQDTEHKLIFELTDNNLHHTLIFSDAQRNQTIDLAQSSMNATFIAFIYQGMLHIWQGTDHILFLFTLLLTCVMTRSNGHWQGSVNTRQILTKATWVISAFTLAHSITLSLTALDILHLPSRWVEVAIALSVALAALNNIMPLVKPIALLTLFFGLVHGMGFAGVLGELGLPADNRLLTILAFNLGVEIGQLAIVIAVFPVLFYLRNTMWYARFGLNGLSAGITLIAFCWVAQRL